MKQFFSRPTLNSRKTPERGVALLFVILLTSVLLLVSIGITNISYRETTFSFEAQESDRAFFAADTGIECALYLDAPVRGVFSGSGMGSYTCGNPPISPYLVDTSPTFQFVLPLGPRSCALVNVNKAYDALGTGASDYTSISSVGYNVEASRTDPTVCVSGTPGLRVVTRRLFLQYPNSGTSSTTGGGGTGPTVPVVTADIDPTVGTTGGVVTSDGGSPLLQAGFEYTIIPTTLGVTQPFPGTYDRNIDAGFSILVGHSFSTFGYPDFPITSCSTIYMRSWARNAVGTGYSATGNANVACP